MKKSALIEMYELSRLSPSDKQLQDQIDLIEEQLDRNDDAHLSSKANNENESDEELLAISEDVRIDYIIFTLEKWLNNIVICLCITTNRLRQHQGEIPAYFSQRRHFNIICKLRLHCG